MKRLYGFLIFGLLLATTVTAQEKEKAKTMQVRWCGQSFFQIKASDGTLIAFDPHAMSEYGRQIVKADLVIISHLHDDHSQYEVLENADELTIKLSERVIYGVDPKSKGRKWTEIVVKFKNISIRNIPCYHDSEKGMKRGKNSIFVLEVDGLKMVHMGDLGHELDDETVKAIGPVDILMIPIGGIFTINGEKAKEIVKQLKPKRYIFPMHYATRVFEDVQSPAEFLDGQKNVKKIEQNTFTFPIEEKMSAPMIIMMGWETPEEK